MFRLPLFQQYVVYICCIELQGIICVRISFHSSRTRGKLSTFPLLHPTTCCTILVYLYCVYGLLTSYRSFQPRPISQHDRKWCIIDAETHTIVTAREVAKV